jgi:hypothetical protein
MTAIQFYDIIESKLPEDDVEAMRILEELIDLLEEKYEEIDKGK